MSTAVPTAVRWRPRRRTIVVGLLVGLLVVLLVGAGSWAVVTLLQRADLGLRVVLTRPVDAMPGEAPVAPPLRPQGQVRLQTSASVGSARNGLAGIVAVQATDPTTVSVASLMDADGGWRLSRQVEVAAVAASDGFGTVAVLWSDGWLTVRHLSDGSAWWQQRVASPDGSAKYHWAGGASGLTVIDADSVVITAQRAESSPWLVAHRDRTPAVIESGPGCIPAEDVPATPAAAYLVASCPDRIQLTAFGVDAGSTQWRRTTGYGSGVFTVGNGDLLIDSRPRRTLIGSGGEIRQLAPTKATGQSQVLVTSAAGYVTGAAPTRARSTGRLIDYDFRGIPVWQVDASGADLGDRAASDGNALFTVEGGAGIGGCALVSRSLATGRERQSVRLGPFADQHGCRQQILGVAAGRVLVADDDTIRIFG